MRKNPAFGSIVWFDAFLTSPYDGLNLLARHSGTPPGRRRVARRDPTSTRRSPANRILGGHAQYFDPDAFLPHPNGRYGNAGPNIMLAPGLATFDVNGSKRFQVRKGTGLEFRVEVFNLFNRANFAAPQPAVIVDGTTQVRADAGRITQTVGTPRQAQLGLRFSF